jgi:hypothetical protein
VTRPPIDLPPDVVERIAAAVAQVIVASIRRDEAAREPQRVAAPTPADRRIG